MIKKEVSRTSKQNFIHIYKWTVFAISDIIILQKSLNCGRNPEPGGTMFQPQYISHNICDLELISKNIPFLG